MVNVAVVVFIEVVAVVVTEVVLEVKVAVYKLYSFGSLLLIVTQIFAFLYIGWQETG